VPLTSDELLKTLPPQVKVMNCAHCGRLLTRSSVDHMRFRHLGLRKLAGFTKFDRPICDECVFHGLKPTDRKGHGRVPQQLTKMIQINKQAYEG